MTWLDPEMIKQRIALLDEIRFVRFCNTLLARMAARNVIDPSHLALNEHTKDPDGGIDARCVGAPRPVGRLIPRLNVAYQFKAGSQKKSARAIAEGDIRDKPRVRAALESGFAFVIVAGWDRGDAFEEEIAVALAELGIEVEEDQVRFIGSGTLAHLVAGLPAVVAEFLGVDLNLFTFDHWSRIGRLDNPFRTDTALDRQLTDLRASIAVPSAVVRITGAAGNGKTRTVMEALRSSGLEDTVLYAQQRNDLSPSFLSYLRSTPGAECTLVVDEVDDLEAEWLTDAFVGMPAGVRLVTIGVDAAVPRHDALRLASASPILLADIIGAIVPGLPDEIRSRIADACEGSPKLAVLIARRIERDPDIVAPHRYLADRQVQDELGRLLGITEADPGWRALSCIALLERVGWLEEAESESVALFVAAGLDADVAREQVHRLDRAFGIAPLAGRFRYVSPQILADHLALRQLESWSGERVRGLVAALTPAMADSFARRLRRTGAALANRGIIEEAIFGEHGPFRSLKDLEDSGGASLLRHLSGAFPHAALSALKRVIGSAPDAEISTATRSRRDLVVALTELLWRRDTFPRSAELLLRLACNETEHWANNATGTWIETFQTILGRTEANATARAAVLRRAATSDDARARQLAARALGAALKVGDISRGGMPPRELEGMPEEAWQPETYLEWFDAIFLYLPLLGSLLGDPDPAVQQAAAGALAEGVGAAVQFPPVTDAWITTARTLREGAYASRAEVARAVDDALAHWETEREEVDEAPPAHTADGQDSRVQLTLEGRERLTRLRYLRDELLGSEFSSLLRWTLTQNPWRGAGTWEEEQERIISEVAKLAVEIIEDPERLRSELDWLREQEMGISERLFEALGRADSGRRLLPFLGHALGLSPREIGWRSLYEVSYATAHGGDAFLDHRLAELEDQENGGERTFDLLLRINPTADRTTRLLQLFETGSLPVGQIARLVYGPWRRTLAPADVVRLARVALASGERASVRSAVSLVYYYLHDYPDRRDELRDVAVDLLVYQSKEPSGERVQDEWSDLAGMYIDAEPVRLVHAALQHAADREAYHDEDLHQLIRRAWEVGEKHQLFADAIAPWLGAPAAKGWYARKLLLHVPIEKVGLEELAGWIMEDPGMRAEAVAEIAGAPGVPVSDFHAMLLERFSEYGTGSAFIRTHLSGAFWGSAVAWERGKLAEAKEWAKDERPAVREWAEGVVRSLELMLEQSTRREAEDRFRW